VDRFFSKLDLRDIKIDPFKTSFPPDADETEPVEAAADGERRAEEARDEPGAAGGWDRPERRPHVPAWAAPAAAAPSINGFADPVAAGADPDEDAVAAPTWPAEPGGAPRVAGAGEAAPAGQPSGEILKVSARSRPSAVAGAIAGVVREVGRAEVQAIGAGATNQAVKAVAIARDYLRETGIEAICLPAFIDVTIENEDRTAIRLVVEPR
jgi:stage V sporulation protein S